MTGEMRMLCFKLLLAMLTVVWVSSSAFADERPWSVSKSSGDVSVTTTSGQQSTLAAGVMLNPGDNVRTGQNGRVLLTRGEETILISPNSSIGIPAQRKSELDTTIIQQAGSILLEVEKRNVQHFQVETPYLAAVVKGTQFRVDVTNKETRVEVLRGQVQVSDFKSGQYAMVTPGQAAAVTTQGSAGLSVSGSGALPQVQQGSPRSASVSPLQIFNEGALAPATVSKAQPLHIAQTASEPLARAWVQDNSSSKTGWGAGFGSWGDGMFGSSGGKRSRQDDVTLAAGISCAVGFLVALTVGAQRRRKSKKLEVRR
jgi:hypothetical protein